MKSNEKRLLKGVSVILATGILGLGVVFIGCRPIYNIVKADFLQTVVEGQPTMIVRDAQIIVSEQSGQKNQNSLQIQYGALKCSTISLNVPVYLGDTEEKLLYGVGIYAGGSVPGKNGTTLIAGHDSTYFKPLENIKAGDVIEFTNQTDMYRYKVRETKIEKASEEYTFNQTDKQELVLYTCYPFGDLTENREQRFFVYCDLIEQNKGVQ